MKRLLAVCAFATLLASAPAFAQNNPGDAVPDNPARGADGVQTDDPAADPAAAPPGDAKGSNEAIPDDPDMSPDPATDGSTPDAPAPTTPAPPANSPQE